MKEIAIAILNEPVLNDPIHWFENKAYFSLMDHIYNSGFRDNDYNEHIHDVLKKKIPEMTKEDIRTYLTFIFAKDRIIDGFVQDHIENGTIRRLMERYLELEAKE